MSGNCLFGTGMPQYWPQGGVVNTTAPHLLGVAASISKRATSTYYIDCASSIEVSYLLPSASSWSAYISKYTEDAGKNRGVDVATTFNRPLRCESNVDDLFVDRKETYKMLCVLDLGNTFVVESISPRNKNQKRRCVRPSNINEAGKYMIVPSTFAQRNFPPYGPLFRLPPILKHLHHHYELSGAWSMQYKPILYSEKFWCL